MGKNKTKSQKKRNRQSNEHSNVGGKKIKIENECNLKETNKKDSSSNKINEKVCVSNETNKKVSVLTETNKNVCTVNETNQKVSNFKETNTKNLNDNFFVEIDQVNNNIKLFQLSIEKRLSILLSGPVGSGKSLFIDYMAKKMNKTILKLQISDETDSKTLLGGYCCTNIPGEFEWRAGPLITAMKRGYWLVLEDVLSGQSNLLGMLRPLLESETLGLKPKIINISQLNEEIIAHEDFRIIITQSLSEFDDGYREIRIGSTFSPYSMNCLNKSQMILMDKLSSKSIESIIKHHYPKLTRFLNKFIGEQGIMQIVVQQSSSMRSYDRINSPRDLFKFCHRISNINCSIEDEATFYYLDAVDCFLLHISDDTIRQRLLPHLGAVFNLTGTHIENTFYHRTCQISCDPLKNDVIKVGRVELNKRLVRVKHTINPSRFFAQTRQMMQLLETLARCVSMDEPVLLVSETGCGKTSTVQYLSKLVDRKLVIINMNQQSDSSDLLGGYKPVNNALSKEDKKQLDDKMNSLVERFYKAFQSSFNMEKNMLFLGYIKQAHETCNYELLLNLLGNDVIRKGVYSLTTLSETLKSDWDSIHLDIESLRTEIKKLQCSLTFSFIEGALVQAIINGDWVLLDEINLAPPEMLQSLSGLLESSTGSVTLTERGDETPVIRHSDFRLFACMNPATDVGKRNLPQGLRNRFTEIYLQELSDTDELAIIVKYYLGSLSHRTVECVVNFYLALRAGVRDNLIIDGGDSKPQFSLRTLCRALDEIRNISSNKMYKTSSCRAIYEGFCFSFKSQLNEQSRKLFDGIFYRHFNVQISSLQTGSLLSKSINPDQLARDGFTLVLDYPIKIGPMFRSDIEQVDDFVKDYRITKSVSKNLRDLASIVAAGKTLPVLVQGETSVGKTSLITYLAKKTGHICHRVNNHEATDIQEYIGSYVHESDSESKSQLVFKEGVLAQAMRHGHWIILDELNLAPTDILEALNRVLDDNRELFIVETQTTIKAHPMFRLFATQNPPGLYGGRKVLSRALRNRFIELHFNPIPDEELIEILDECSKIPRNKGKKLVEVMRKLQIESQEMNVVHCKRNYISLRDLFRWARRVYYEHNKSDRFFDWDRTMVEEGYLLLTGKARSQDEVNIITRVLSRVFRNIDVQLTDEWFFSASGSHIARSILEQCTSINGLQHIEWTFDFRRIAVLLIRSIQCNEPALLVGNTGCGKTTICQLAALLNNQEMLAINCHMHTEASDFLGGLRPAGNETNDNTRLFQWVDGPLVVAMKEGKMFLIDEISLADDSVLERLNSVLEKDRKLTLVENNDTSLTSSNNNGDNNESVEIQAHKAFQIVATMNPGGDFGKKELSPALRNRFTEIWCPSNSWNTTDVGFNDWVEIAARNLKFVDNMSTRVSVARVLVCFLRCVHVISHEIGLSVVTIRDLLSWVDFINKSVCASNEANPSLAWCISQGAHMVIIDAISEKLNKHIHETNLVAKLDELINEHIPESRQSISQQGDPVIGDYRLITDVAGVIGMRPFYIELGPYCKAGGLPLSTLHYSFSSQTTGSNLYRLFRALQVSMKPLLLEGSPGVGKTSLVSQLARMAGYRVARINLSEQTDANDLFGCFLPTENGAAGELVWRDGPFLQALKAGDWILLDEMNLASQSVLECLNACLDHRGHIFIPELNQTFTVQPGRTRLFACQNPLSEGCGRKGLPKSFVNRFTQVYMSALLADDYRSILTCLYPAIDSESIELMIEFVGRLRHAVIVTKSIGTNGAPWEFNLRDLCRWCDLMLKYQSPNSYEPSTFVSLLFINRFRTLADREATSKLYNELAHQVGRASVFTSSLDVHLNNECLKIGQAQLAIRHNNDVDMLLLKRSLLLSGQLAVLESLMLTVDMGWLSLLVGPSGTGKTSIVNLLAYVTGNIVKTMTMNSAMDTTDLLGSFEQNQGGQFRWVDSLLVQSLRVGHWLVLDTVNFCSASVLDRLNGLLEPNGSLLLTERGLLDGETIEEVRPHPNFRMFLIMDPECGGEISKAMRNRGLELACIAYGPELSLSTEDVSAVLRNVHQVREEDVKRMMRFHTSLVKHKSMLPNIRIGNTHSLFQAARLVNEGNFSVEDSLTAVYTDQQPVFSARSEVHTLFMQSADYPEEEQMTWTIPAGPSVHAMIQDTVVAGVHRHSRALHQIMAVCRAGSEIDKSILSYLFMASSSLDDMELRLNAVQFDESLLDSCKYVAAVLSECRSTASDSPIDFRWLPNWRELLADNCQHINGALFHILNKMNVVSERPDQDIASIKASSLTRQVINSLDVLQITGLLKTHKLSRTVMSDFSGIDTNLCDFIDRFRNTKMSELCCPDNLFELVHVCKLFARLVTSRPTDNSHWTSNLVYHLSSIAEQLGLMDSVRFTDLVSKARLILNSIEVNDLDQCSNFVSRDDLKMAGICRNDLRLNYPHSRLETCFEKYRELSLSNSQQHRSIYQPNGEEALTKSLTHVFYSFFESDANRPSTVNELVDRFDIESVRIWSFMLNILGHVFNTSIGQASVKQLIRFFESSRAWKTFLPPLPCGLTDKLRSCINTTDSNASAMATLQLTTIIDWITFISNQGQLNQTISSCHYNFDEDTQEYSLLLNCCSATTQPQIGDVWTNPNNAIFLLVNGSRSAKDVVAYFQNGKSIKRCLKSFKSRKQQLELCKQLYIECASVLTSDKLRIEHETVLLKDLVGLQRQCICSCFDGVDSVDTWLEKYFPWFLSLERDIKYINHETITLEYIGTLWVRWGSIQIRLFAIMESLDPQSQLYLHKTYLNEEIDQLSREIDLSRMYREFLTGMKQSDRTERCWAEQGLQHPILHASSVRLGQLRDDLAKLSSGTGLRPTGDDMYRDLRKRTLRFLSRYGYTVLCDDTMSQVSNMDSAFVVEWSMASADLLEHLLENRNSMVFPDLIEPLALGLSRTLTGLDLIERSKPQSTLQSKSAMEICRMFCRFPNCSPLELIETILAEEHSILRHCRVLLGEECSQPNVMSKIWMKMLQLSMRLLQWARESGKGEYVDNTRIDSLLHKLLGVFEALWVKQETKRQEREAAEASAYAERQKLTENLTEEELENLEIFMQVVPNKYRVPSDEGDEERAMAMSSTMNTAATKIREMRNRLDIIDQGLVLNEDAVCSVVQLATSILQPQPDCVPDSSVFRDCYRFAAALVSANHRNTVSSSEDLCMFAVNSAALEWEARSQTATGHANGTDKSHDIYQDPVDVNNLLETQEALERLRVSLAELLDLYPEHTSLVAIDRKVTNILHLSLEYPLIVFINNVERLIFELDQWEIVAARHVSLNRHIAVLNRLLVNWRHQELTMWQNTLASARWRQERSVAREYLDYYHLVAKAAVETAADNFNQAEAINSIIDPIVHSLCTATVGTYAAKLRVLELVIASVQSMPGLSLSFRRNLRAVLLNHRDYYRLFASSITAHSTAEYKRIGKELKDFIRTKKWGDSPPKLTDVARCHKIVLKYNRQWSAVLGQATSGFLVLAPINALKSITPVSQSSTASSMWCEEILKYCTDMWHTMEQFQTETRELETRAAVEAKRKDDEPDLEKKWIGHVKNLQQRKRNCIVEFVKELRSMGLNAHHARIAIDTALMTHLPMGDVRDASLTGSEATLSTVRCVALRLQMDEADKSPEFAKFNDLKDRLIGICDHLLTMACSNCIRFNNAHAGLEAMRIASSVLGVSVRSSALGGSHCVSSVEIENKLHRANEATASVLRQWLVFIDSLACPASPEISAASVIADQLKPAMLLEGQEGRVRVLELLRTVSGQVDSTRVPRGYLVTEEHLQCLSGQTQIASAIDQLVDSIDQQFRPAGAVVNGNSNIWSSVASGLARVNRQHHATIDAIKSSLVVAPMEHDGSQLDNMAALVDELRVFLSDSNNRFKSLVSNTTESNLSFFEMVALLDRQQACFETGRVEQMLAVIRDQFQTTSPSRVVEHQIRIRQEIVPLLDSYLELEAGFLVELRNFHNTILAMLDGLLTVTAKLMKDGLCVPSDAAWRASDSSEQSDRNEKMNDFDMAGMGHGTGEQDVSDQIESESQIEGHNKEPQQQDVDNQDDVADNENGIEMSDDFDAKMHDPEVDENGDKQNEQDERDQDELEDKMGDVGDAAETDVNKQAWDEEKTGGDEPEQDEEEDQKEKNKDDRQGGMSEKNTTKMVANENEDDQGDDDKVGGKENKSSEEQETMDTNELEENEDSKNDKEGNGNGDESDDVNQPEEPGVESGEMENEAGNEPEEPNRIDEFWDDDCQFDAGEEAGGENQDNKDDQNDGEPEQVEGGGKEDNIDDLKPIEEGEESVSMQANDEIAGMSLEQQVLNNGSGAGQDANDEQDKDMTSDPTSEHADDGGNHGSHGNGADNGAMNTESAQGGMDRNEPTRDNTGSRDAPQQKRRNEDKSRDNRSQGDVDKPFKRQAEVLDVDDAADDENDDDNGVSPEKRARTTDAFSHIDKDKANGEDEQVLDDASSEQQQQLIPDATETGTDQDPEQSKVLEDDQSDFVDKKKRQVLEVDKNSMQQDRPEPDQQQTMARALDSQVELACKKRLCWSEYEARTEHLARQLCENLRMVLEPTKANKLGGAYRTGKRLNMKKVIPYIASGFRKDKIWLRRNKPSQREYQVLIGVDNSTSIADNVDPQLFFESLATLLNGLTYLEVGQVGLCKFGSSAEVVLSLQQPFSPEIGEKLVETFDFSDRSTRFVPMLEQAIALFEQNRHSLSSMAPRDMSQLLLLISDGGTSEDVNDTKFVSLVQEAHNRGIFVVVILLDYSILNSQSVNNEDGDFVRFLDVFPLQNYTVVEDVTKLPNLLTDVLRQWFELSSSSDKGPSR